MLRSTRLFAPLLALLIALFLVPAAADAGSKGTPAKPFFIDSDVGVDDAVAIAWLIDQPNIRIVGFSTVSGNTSTENAARNLLTLFGAIGRSFPVTVGAAAPLEFPATRTGALVHGPDGFWFNQAPVDISSLPTNAPAALAAAARANPGLTIIALGPLTNIAQAIQQYPADMAGVRLVALGGARHGGNSTPVSEFNIYADPHALAIVLASDIEVELVTLDAFNQVKVDVKRFPARLKSHGGAVGQLLARTLEGYFGVQEAGGPVKEVALPDVAAVIYALHPNYGTAQSALVNVISATDLTRGQTVIATELADRITAIASEAELSALAEQAFLPGFDFNAALAEILARQPDNASVILDVEEKQMVRLLEKSLTH